MAFKWYHCCVYHIGVDDYEEEEAYLALVSDYIATVATRNDAEYTTLFDNGNEQVFIQETYKDKSGTNRLRRVKHERIGGGFGCIIGQHFSGRRGDGKKSHLHIVYYRTNNDINSGPPRWIYSLRSSRGSLVFKQRDARCLARLQLYFNDCEEQEGQRVCTLSKVESRCSAGKECTCPESGIQGQYSRSSTDTQDCDYPCDTESSISYGDLGNNQQMVVDGTNGRGGVSRAESISGQDVRAAGKTRSIMAKQYDVGRKYVDPRNIQQLVVGIWTNSEAETDALIRCDDSLSDICFSNNFSKYLNEAYLTVRARFRAMTWESILRCIPADCSLSVLSPADSAHVICSIFQYNGLTIQVLKNIYSICTKSDNNKGALWFHGPPYCGKTVIGSSLAKSFRFYATQNKFDKSNFCFAPFVNQCFLFVDECYLSGSNFETFKKIAEGVDQEVEIKHKDMRVVQSTPMWISTNHYITHQTTNPKQCLEQLLKRVHFQELAPMPDLAHLPTSKLHPRAWLLIMSQLNKWECSDSLELGYYDKFDTFDINNYFK